jgi:hypothetical protein
MFEQSSQPLLPRTQFAQRMAASGVQASVVISCWLLVGVFGYHHIAGFRWIDALLNASMIMSGMGPCDRIDGDGAKVFASVYAILSGVIFLSTAAILVAPIAHRFLHHFHKNNPARS